MYNKDQTRTYAIAVSYHTKERTPIMPTRLAKDKTKHDYFHCNLEFTAMFPDGMISTYGLWQNLHMVATYFNSMMWFNCNWKTHAVIGPNLTHACGELAVTSHLKERKQR